MLSIQEKLSMPTLTIDNRAVTVPDGTNVLEAARSIGITIPHFCWHPALGRAGACRVCAVKLLDGPVKGLQMSCMLPAQDGMVVSTSDEEAMALRKSVIEWLMINHPHDCPVCDEGGECQLQDFTIAGGHSIRRYDGRKRTHVNQYLGTQIEHEMNRCIQCYRCVRFYQEYAGGTDFGVTGRAASVYFGRQQDGQLESPFSGNLVDICPTGVFTDKTARFRARYWDYDMAPSVCPHCSLGCNTIPVARYRELLKTTARRNDDVNGWFICDRGRFSNDAVNAPDRPRNPLVDGEIVTMDVALNALTERLSEFLELHGPESLAIVGSPRMSLEGNIMAARLREIIGAGSLCFFGDAAQASLAHEAVTVLTTNTCVSMQDIRSADLIAIVDCNLLEKAPMMALAVRQAWRSGAMVYVIGSNTSQHTLFKAEVVKSLDLIAFTDTSRNIIISGACSLDCDAIDTASTSGVKRAFILDAPNTFGCALLAREHDAVSFSESLLGGTIKGIISLEADLTADLLPKIRVLASMDWLPTDLMKRAEVALPVTSWVEMDGTFVNNEGRAQHFKQVMQPGLPINGLTAELQPPREHRHDTPGGAAIPSWHIVVKMLERMYEYRIDEPLSGLWEYLRNLDAESAGELVNKKK
jgi:NADH-quinone oxidoreductase subunit G